MYFAAPLGNGLARLLSNGLKSCSAPPSDGPKEPRTDDGCASIINIVLYSYMAIPAMPKTRTTYSSIINDARLDLVHHREKKKKKKLRGPLTASPRLGLGLNHEALTGHCTVPYRTSQSVYRLPTRTHAQAGMRDTYPLRLDG